MTIVNRRTFIPKRGYYDEVLAMMSPSESWRKRRFRIYSDHYGTFDRVALEIEFESMAEMEQAWADWFQTEEAEEFKRWVEVTEPGGKNEIWVLEESG